MDTPLIDQRNKSEILVSNEFPEMIIKYRLYAPEDSQGMISLEEEASQHNTIFGLVKSGSIYREHFENKSKCFKEYIILVAEATTKSDNNSRTEICGGVCLGLKEIYFNQQLRKAGILYDLRVSERYQRKGIGTTLCAELEKLALAKGCDFIYLSVNTRNNKAIFLYDKLGYQLISNRRILSFGVPEQRNEVAPTIKEIEASNNRKIQLFYNALNRDETIKYYTQFYKGQDLALGNWEELVDSPGYIGTYCVRTFDSKNIAGMSLFRIKKIGFMGIKKLFVDISWYSHVWSTAIILTIFLLAFNGVFNSLLNWPQSWGIGNPWAKIIGYLMLGGVTWLLSYGILKVTSILKTFGGYGSRGRTIGPFYLAQDEELVPHMLTFLGERIGVSLANEDIGWCTYNCDSNDYFASRIPGISSRGGGTRFMGKFLRDGNLRDYQFSKFSYFDPRDL